MEVREAMKQTGDSVIDAVKSYLDKVLLELKGLKLRGNLERESKEEGEAVRPSDGSPGSRRTKPDGLLDGGGSRDSRVMSSQLPESHSRPNSINQIEPKTFRGDPRKATSWMKQYEATMRSNGLTEQQMLVRAEVYMKGPALDWYMVTMALSHNIAWPDFKSKFLKHFVRSSITSNLYAEIGRYPEAIQMNDEHPSDFLMRIVNLCLQYDPSMPERAIIERVHQGLRPEFANLMSAQKSPHEWTIDWLADKFPPFIHEDLDYDQRKVY